MLGGSCAMSTMNLTPQVKITMNPIKELNLLLSSKNWLLQNRCNHHAAYVDQ